MFFIFHSEHSEIHGGYYRLLLVWGFRAATNWCIFPSASATGLALVVRCGFGSGGLSFAAAHADDIAIANELRPAWWPELWLCLRFAGEPKRTPAGSWESFLWTIFLFSECLWS